LRQNALQDQDRDQDRTFQDHMTGYDRPVMFTVSRSQFMMSELWLWWKPHRTAAAAAVRTWHIYLPVETICSQSEQRQSCQVYPDQRKWKVLQTRSHQHHAIISSPSSGNTAFWRKSNLSKNDFYSAINHRIIRRAKTGFTLLSLPSPPLSKRRYCAARRHAVMMCVYPPSHLYNVLTARCISHGGEGNALYTVLSIVIVIIISGTFLI